MPSAQGRPPPPAKRCRSSWAEVSQQRGAAEQALGQSQGAVCRCGQSSLGTPVPLGGPAPTAAGMPTQPRALCTVTAGLSRPWSLGKNPAGLPESPAGGWEEGAPEAGEALGLQLRGSGLGPVQVSPQGADSQGRGPAALLAGAWGTTREQDDHTAQPEDRDGRWEVIRPEGRGDSQSAGGPGRAMCGVGVRGRGPGAAQSGQAGWGMGAEEQ